MRYRRGVATLGLVLAGASACGSDGPPNLSGLSGSQFTACSAASHVGRPAGDPSGWSAPARAAYLRQPAVLDCVVVLPPTDRAPLLEVVFGTSFDQALPVLTAYVQTRAPEVIAQAVAQDVGRMLHYVHVSGSGGRSATDVAALENELLAVRIYQHAYGPLPGYPVWAARHRTPHGEDPATYYYDEVVLPDTGRPEFGKAYEVVQRFVEGISDARRDEGRT